MDVIVDEKYLEKLNDLLSKVNPKPYSEDERKRLVMEKLQLRNNKMFRKEVCK